MWLKRSRSNHAPLNDDPVSFERAVSLLIGRDMFSGAAHRIVRQSITGPVVIFYGGHEYLISRKRGERYFVSVDTTPPPHEYGWTKRTGRCNGPAGTYGTQLCYFPTGRFCFTCRQYLCGDHLHIHVGKNGRERA